jgi:hypothetical protein
MTRMERNQGARCYQQCTFSVKSVNLITFIAHTACSQTNVFDIEISIRDLLIILGLFDDVASLTDIKLKLSQ